MKRLESRVGGKCRPGPGLPLVWAAVLFALLSAGTKADGQYLGGGRPMTRQEMVDSLSARLDTAAATALRAEMPDSAARVAADSNAALRLGIARGDSAKIDTSAIRAGSNVTLDKYYSQGRLDSLRISAAGAGGGGGLAHDTIYYKRIFGFTRQDSAAYASFSGFRYIVGGRADSLAGDTLVAAIKACKTGGNILILGGDSLYCFVGDSLLPADSISGTVNINGIGRDRSIIAGVDHGFSNGALFFRGRFKGGKIRFNDLAVINTAGAQTQDNYSNVIGFVAKANAEFNSCFLSGPAVGWLGVVTSGTDSIISFNNCVLDRLVMTTRTDSAANGAFVELNGCRGSLWDFYHYRSNLSGAMVFTFVGCDLTVNRIRFTGYNTTAPLLMSGCKLRQYHASAEYPIWVELPGAVNQISGSNFYFDANATYNAIAINNGDINGCGFYDGGVILTGTGGSVKGSGFYSSVSGAYIIAGYNAVLSNNFVGCTTAIYVAGSLTGVVVHGNTGVSNSTSINGTPNVNTDNTWN